MRWRDAKARIASAHLLDALHDTCETFLPRRGQGGSGGRLELSFPPNIVPIVLLQCETSVQGKYIAAYVCTINQCHTQ